MEERKGDTGFWWGDVIETDHLEYLGVSGRIILKWMFTGCDIWSCTGLFCLRIRKGGGMLSMR
jgi:hypothetical protein